MEQKSLCEEVKEMKKMSELLLHLTFPRVDFNTEQDVLILKQRPMVVDGYDVIVCYSKADYDDHFMESLQIQSSFAPFLPFAVICKIGKAFLGHRHLSYIEFFKHNKKVYCWTIKTREGSVMPPDKRSQPNSYEGFEYSLLQPGTVDLL